MKQRFDYNLAAVFIKVVEHKSLTRAADALSMPKATISRKITALEDMLGVRLLQRTTRSLNLTDAGKRYYEKCRLAIDVMHEANLEVTRKQETPKGELRITAPIVFGDKFLSEPLTNFMASYPDIQVKVELTDRLVDLVAEGFDVAFRVGQLTDSSYVARRLGKTRQVIVASPEYLQKHGCPESPRDFGKFQLIGYSESLRKTFKFRGPTGEVSVSLSRARLIVNSLNVMLGACEQGMGITVLPSFTTMDALKRGTLKIILPQWHLQFGDLYLVYPSRRHIPATMRVFIEHMSRFFSQHQPWLPREEALEPYFYPSVDAAVS
jgi:DNA-binding transcriptional LysR family regulator